MPTALSADATAHSVCPALRALKRYAANDVAPETVALGDVRVFLGGKKAVLDVDGLTICRGERIALVGPSGAGKTTLLRLVAGHVRSDEGSVRVLGRSPRRDGRFSRRTRRLIGLVPQDFALIDRASVFENVLAGRLGHVNQWSSLLGLFPTVDRTITCEAIEEVGLGDRPDQRADTLSGGQRQRVAIARTLAQEPEVILADEPVSNLDPVLTEEALRLLTAAAARRAATLIVSLHQPFLAHRFAHRIIGLDAQGRVAFDGPIGDFGADAMEAIYGRGAGDRLVTGPVAPGLG